MRPLQGFASPGATREPRAIESRDAACFHAGHCAEKLMKALLIHFNLMSPDDLATLDGPLWPSIALGNNSLGV